MFVCRQRDTGTHPFGIDNMMNLRTLPVLAVELGIPLEITRKIIRRDERLNALGVKLGNARGYTDEEAEVIRRALDEHRARWPRFHAKTCAAAV